MRFFTGTRTLSKKTWLISWSPSGGPSRVLIAWIVIPGVVMSSSRNDIPIWRIGSWLVRTRQNIQSAHWP